MKLVSKKCRICDLSVNALWFEIKLIKVIPFSDYSSVLPVKGYGRRANGRCTIYNMLLLLHELITLNFNRKI